MTPEGTETFILAFISKMEQSVAQNSHIIFSFGFFYEREDIFRLYIGRTSDFRLQGYSSKRILCIVSSIFRSAQPAPVQGNTDLRYHISRLNQNPQHISCRVDERIISIANVFLNEFHGEIQTLNPSNKSHALYQLS